MISSVLSNNKITKLSSYKLFCHSWPQHLRPKGRAPTTLASEKQIYFIFLDSESFFFFHLSTLLQKNSTIVKNSHQKKLLRLPKELFPLQISHLDLKSFVCKG